MRKSDGLMRKNILPSTLSTDFFRITFYFIMKFAASYPGAHIFTYVCFCVRFEKILRSACCLKPN